MLLITHELDIAEYGTRIVTFRDGQVVSRPAGDERRRLAEDELATLPAEERRPRSQPCRS